MARCRMDYWALVDYMEGRADEATRARVESHLSAGCATCQARLDRLARLLPALQELDRLHTPAPAIDRADALFRERLRASERGRDPDSGSDGRPLKEEEAG